MTTPPSEPAPTFDPRAEVNTSGKPFVRLDRTPGDPVAEIVFDRPEKLNAWAWGPTNELCAIADELRFDATVRVVVMRAEGRAFCAGEDLKPERHDVHERHTGRSPAEQVRNSYERARYCFDGPTGALVEAGVTYAGGIREHLAVEDLRPPVASDFVP